MGAFEFVVRVSVASGLVVASCHSPPNRRPFDPEFAIPEGGSDFGEGGSSENASGGKSSVGGFPTDGGEGSGASAGAGGSAGSSGGAGPGGAGRGGKPGAGGQAGRSPSDGGTGAAAPDDGGAGQGGDAAGGGTAGTSGGGASGAGAGGAAGTSGGGASGAGVGGGGAGGSWACGEPTAELDSDGDLLNDACDPDRDEDGVANDADFAPRDPLNPPITDAQLPRAPMPGIMLADACVKAALPGANAALASAGLSVRLPASLQHEPPVLPQYALRPWDEQRGYWVGGPDATPGAPLDGAEIKLIESAPAKVSYQEAAFNDAGLQTTRFAAYGTVRGTPTSANLFVLGGPLVHLIAGNYEDGNLVGVVTLSVRVGTGLQRSYPNATCPSQLGRWALSYAPIWQGVEPESFTYSCLDGGEAHFPISDLSWTRDAPPEECRCKPVFTTPGVRSTIECEATGS
jgi:hypothetical protein